MSECVKVCVRRGDSVRGAVGKLFKKAQKGQ